MITVQFFVCIIKCCTYLKTILICSLLVFFTLTCADDLRVDDGVTKYIEMETYLTFSYQNYFLYLVTLINVLTQWLMTMLSLYSHWQPYLLFIIPSNTHDLLIFKLKEKNLAFAKQVYMKKYGHPTSVL